MHASILTHHTFRSFASSHQIHKRREHKCLLTSDVPTRHLDKRRLSKLAHSCLAMPKHLASCNAIGWDLAVEETSNAMALDGIMFEGVSVRVRRPNDYNPAAAASLGPSVPSGTLNLAAIGLQPGGMQARHNAMYNLSPVTLMCNMQGS